MFESIRGGAFIGLVLAAVQLLFFAPLLLISETPIPFGHFAWSSAGGAVGAFLVFLFWGLHEKP